MAGAGEDSVADWISSVPVPVVFVDRRVESSRLAKHDSVRSDHTRGIALAVEHLVRLGHDRIGLALFHRTATTPLVREGFAAVTGRLGLLPGPFAVLPDAVGQEVDELDPSLTLFLNECLDTDTRAVIIHTDDHASRLVELAVDRDIRVPEDLCIISYDDIHADLALVSLTAVAAPRREIGREALQLLHNRMAEDPGERAAPRHVILMPELVVRDSCGSVR